MLGKTVVGWLWLKMADKALDAVAESSHHKDQSFVADKLQAVRYFIRWELPEVELQARLLQGFDRTCLDMQHSILRLNSELRVLNSYLNLHSAVAHSSSLLSCNLRVCWNTEYHHIQQRHHHQR